MGCQAINKVPVYSEAEQEFQDKYSKETLALMSFIKSRRQISQGSSTGVRGLKKSVNPVGLSKSNSVNKIINPRSQFIKGSKAVQYENAKPSQLLLSKQKYAKLHLKVNNKIKVEGLVPTKLDNTLRENKKDNSQFQSNSDISEVRELEKSPSRSVRKLKIICL